VNLDTARRLQECVDAALAKLGHKTRIPQLRTAYVEFVVPKGCEPGLLKTALDLKLAERGLYADITVRKTSTQTRIRLTYKT